MIMIANTDGPIHPSAEVLHRYIRRSIVRAYAGVEPCDSFARFISYDAVSAIEGRIRRYGDRWEIHDAGDMERFPLLHAGTYRDLNRYDHILQSELARLALMEDEAMLVVDAQWRIGAPEGQYWRVPCLMEEEAITHELDRKWGVVDRCALFDRLYGHSDATYIALLDACDQVRYPSRGYEGVPLRVRVRQIGLVQDPGSRFVKR